MSLRTIATVGWICFGLDLLFVLLLFASKNMGDDAAGRGMARGFSYVLGPIVLGLGGLLFWAQRSGSFGGVLVATLLAGLPFLVMAKNVVMGPVDAIDRALGRMGRGRFANATLTGIASAMKTGDTARVRALASRPGIDWSARDRKGRTILGIAVDAATTPNASDVQTELVHVLVEAGARYQDDAITENGRMFSDVVFNSGDRYVALMDDLLTAGADPNDTERYDDRPLLIHHNMTVAKARVLLRHGADLRGIRDNREDRPGWDALMNAVCMRNWPLATLFLEQGSDPTYTAQDGKSVRDVIGDVRLEQGLPREPRRTEPDELGEGFGAFRTLLAERLKRARH